MFYVPLTIPPLAYSPQPCFIPERIIIVVVTMLTVIALLLVKSAEASALLTLALVIVSIQDSPTSCGMKHAF